MATLTYVYADSTAVVGPLATYAEPHCYDLCTEHAERLTAPRGWEIIRQAVDESALAPTADDLEALANAVREAAQPTSQADSPDHDMTRPTAQSSRRAQTGRRGHLWVLPTPES